EKLRPKAKVYVINIDLFFEQSESPPGQAVMHDRTAKTRYEQKRYWQRIHEPICRRFPAVCGDGYSFFRSRTTGAWVALGGRQSIKPVSYEETFDPSIVEAYASSGTKFLSHLKVPPACVVLTMVPTVMTPIGTAKATAAALGMNLVAPELEG